ncbi:MAG: hypothetical protein ACR2RA_00855 [Geminicoccaceae bacterium]
MAGWVIDGEVNKRWGRPINGADKQSAGRAIDYWSSPVASLFPYHVRGGQNTGDRSRLQGGAAMGEASSRGEMPQKALAMPPKYFTMMMTNQHDWLDKTETSSHNSMT